MQYKLEWCSWEITRRCNMNCDICLCGSEKTASPSEGLAGELTKEEGLELCNQIAAMGVNRVVFTGGEPLMREDWDILAKALTEQKVEVQLMSNGYFIDQEMIRRIRESGVSRVCISIDGTEEIHDAGRMKGSYSHCIRAVKLLIENGVSVSCATTITAKNLDNLPELKTELVQAGVRHWLLQLGMPYGNMKHHKDQMVQPEDMDKIIDFCYNASDAGEIMIYPGDSIGYYTQKEALVRSRALNTEKIPLFRGCPSGISSLNIAHDGTILGMSLCVDGFIEGNIRERSLKDIWEDENAFAWRRRMNRQQLEGACRDCQYADLCLGGCPAIRFATTGKVCGENRYCAYAGRKK